MCIAAQSLLNGVSVGFSDVMVMTHIIQFQFSSSSARDCPGGLIGHLLRCFRYQLSEMYRASHMQLGYSKQPRLPACATNDEEASHSAIMPLVPIIVQL